MEPEADSVAITLRLEQHEREALEDLRRALGARSIAQAIRLVAVHWRVVARVIELEESEHDQR